MICRTAHPPTDPAISLVEESGRVQRAANFPVARYPGLIPVGSQTLFFFINFSQ